MPRQGQGRVRQSREWTELPEEAHKYADTIGRLGRAVAVNLIAATQRPTQSAMGKNTSVRPQMDIRVCLRVREPRDADLILGQGMTNTGWHAHKLTQPGEFLLSDPEHTTPERHRAYLLSDARRDFPAPGGHSPGGGASRVRQAARRKHNPLLRSTIPPASLWCGVARKP